MASGKEIKKKGAEEEKKRDPRLMPRLILAIVAVLLGIVAIAVPFIIS